jgi:hypothetical protein
MNFRNDRHALYCGWVLGTLMKRGYNVRPVVDPEGDYLPRVRFIENDPAMSFELIIEEPPEDWAMR